MKLLLKIRYYLEIIAVPAFIFLVIHMAGHGLTLFHEADHHHDEGFHLDHLWSAEFLFGLVFMFIFVGIWHLKFMKKLVPCSHDHCHHLSVWSHGAAILAFIFHFFPESAIRHDFMSSFEWTSVLSLAGGIAFFTHFLVDVIIMFLLSKYWKKTWQQGASFIIIVICWFASFWVGSHGGFHLPHWSEGMVMMVSAFLLAMFVHVPHKPVVECHSCDDC